MLYISKQINKSNYHKKTSLCILWTNLE